MMKPLLCLAVCLLSISAAAPRSGAVTLAGSDDFDDNLVDPALWGADSGSGTFSETNQRLEYTVSPAADALPIRPWILSPASYDEDWSIQLDIHVGNVSLPSDGQDLLLGFGVTNGASVAALNIEFENLSGTLLRGFHAVNEGLGGSPEVMVASTTTDGAGRLTFDGVTKELRYWYDEDGSTGGDPWTLFQTVDLDAPGTDWGLSIGANLSIVIFAESHGIAVASGDAFGDNFSVIPEPGTGLLVMTGLLALAFRRRIHPVSPR
jgi:hypothetical protein